VLASTDISSSGHLHLLSGDTSNIFGDIYHSAEGTIPSYTIVELNFVQENSILIGKQRGSFDRQT
jgi:hypothetical protein